MPDANEFKSKRPAFTVAFNSLPGAGKTRAMMGFPKVYVIGCDPSGLDILYQKGNEQLLANLVWYEYLHNESEAELKRLFAESVTEGGKPVRAVGPDDRWSLYGCLAHAKQLAKDKQIETLAIDGFNYLVDMKWQAICEYEEIRSKNSGERDTQGMYRNLGLYLQRFVAADLMTMATRQGLNVILTTHLKRESPEALEGTKTRAAKVDKSADLAPLIEGGFRSKFDGLLGAVIYLEHKYLPSEKRLEYFAITERMPGLDSIAVPAKNRYGLHGRLTITGKSFYSLLMENVNPSVKITTK
jgi:hypothetical protein